MSGNSRAFVFDLNSKQLIDLTNVANFPIGLASFAYSCDSGSLGQPNTVGSVITSNGAQAYLFGTSSCEAINIPNSTASNALAIHGDSVVGNCYLGSYDSQAFHWSKSTKVASILPPLAGGIATAESISGNMIYGSSTDANGNHRACYWDLDELPFVVPHDLNDSLPIYSQATLTSARAESFGNILAQGELQGAQTGFTLHEAWLVEIDAPVAGSSGSLMFSPAPSGSLAQLAGSLSRGYTPISQLPGLICELSQPVLIDTQVGGWGGLDTVTFDFNVPYSLAGSTVYFQAVSFAYGQTSDVLEIVIQ